MVAAEGTNFRVMATARRPLPLRREKVRAEGRSSMVECGTTVIKRNSFRRVSLIGSVLSSIDHQRPT